MSNIPSKSEILDWIRENPSDSGKREIARAFGLRGPDKIELKKILRELKDEGHLTRERKAKVAGALSNVELLHVTAIDKDGDLFAEPLNWKGETKPPVVLYVAKKGDPALTIGDRILCNIAPTDEEHIPYEGRLIRKIGSGPDKIIGIFRQADYGGRIEPVDKKSNREWRVEPGDRNGARDGELVEAVSIMGRARMGLLKAKVTGRIGDPTAPKAVSLIAIHEHGIPDSFPDAALEDAADAKPTDLGNRLDLRHLPLFTIDPADARDHDDAICALPDDDPKNEGGHIVWVAIADVAHYVLSGSALDREAKNRGNSTYFPDRVVPMLPDALSGDLCSLHEGVDRPCLAVRMVLDASGHKIKHDFHRAYMRSPASLSYQQAQAAQDGEPDEQTAPLLESGIKPLFAAYFAATKARNARQPLHLDLPERRIVLTEDGTVESVAFRERLDAHKLVEEFMVLANVCAAETLEAKRRPFVYRVHEEPKVEKIDALREVVETIGLSLPKGQVLKTSALNQILDRAPAEVHDLVNMAVLRSMTQAYYSPQNFGHFGLNLKRYAHFTSPIRRYSDLIVHRALISAHGWGKDGLSDQDVDNMDKTAEHISQTERRSMLAERDTNDRYLAAFLSEHIGNEFEGTVSGVARFGLFVKLNETGADGLIPISSLGREYFHFDADTNTLTGESSRRLIGLGMKAKVRLVEAAPVTGGLLLEMISLEGKALVSRPAGGRGKSRARPKVSAAKKKAQKINRSKSRVRANKPK
ncbi:MAG TPA: ribonuclease R [Paracoccaceae bacterium]|nr:ribonuclease R [Paracoccaceae bacterium]